MEPVWTRPWASQGCPHLWHKASAGSAVTLDGTNSRPGPGAALTAYEWTITGGASLAGFTSATNAPGAVLLTRAPGAVTVTLTVTDSAGRQATNSVMLAVSASADAIPPPPSGSDGTGSQPADPTPLPSTSDGGNDNGGGGGGAMHPGWLLGWLAAVIGVRRVTPRQRAG